MKSLSSTMQHLAGYIWIRSKERTTGKVWSAIFEALLRKGHVTRYWLRLVIKDQIEATAREVT